jgi:hypothetical protein
VPRVIRLLGLLEDGSTRAATMQASAQRRLSWQRGESVRLLVECRTPAGVPVDLTGATFAFCAGMSFQAPSLTKAGAVVIGEGPSVVAVDVLPSDYGSLAAARTRFVYDFWMLSGSDRHVLIPTSPLDLLDTVRPPG